MIPNDAYELFMEACEYCSSTANFKAKLDTFKHVYDTYSSPNRYYHNWQHIAGGLSEIGHLVVKDRDYLELVIPWLYHDYVINYQNTDEVNSETECERVCKHTLNLFSSKSHWIAGTDHVRNRNSLSSMQEILHDIDLVSLASDNFTFENNTLLIYKEVCAILNKEIEWKTFLKNRRDFFKRMLNNGPIFYTDYYQQQYEDMAQFNLQNLITE